MPTSAKQAFLGQKMLAHRSTGVPSRFFALTRCSMQIPQPHPENLMKSYHIVTLIWNLDVTYYPLYNLSLNLWYLWMRFHWDRLPSMTWASASMKTLHHFMEPWPSQFPKTGWSSVVIARRQNRYHLVRTCCPLSCYLACQLLCVKRNPNQRYSVAMAPPKFHPSKVHLQGHRWRGETCQVEAVCPKWTSLAQSHVFTVLNS